MSDKFPKEYTISADLLQAVVSLLGEQPARISRNILNSIEYMVNIQNEAFDEAKNKKADADKPGSVDSN